jgi:hypothetical protein
MSEQFVRALARADDTFVDLLWHGTADTLRRLVVDLLSGDRAPVEFRCPGCTTIVLAGECTGIDRRNRLRPILVCRACSGALDRTGHTIGEIARGTVDTEPNMDRIDRAR